MSHVAWSVCLSVLVRRLCCANKRLKRPRYRLGADSRSPKNDVLDGSQDRTNPFAAVIWVTSRRWMRPFAKLPSAFVFDQIFDIILFTDA